MASLLTDMQIDEISLVDDGANEGARVAIVKAKGGKKPPMDEEADPNETEPDGDADDAKPAPKGSKSKKIPMAKIAGAVLAAIEELSPEIVEKAMAEGFSADPDAAASAAAIIKETVMDFQSLTKALEDAEAKLDALEKRAIDAEVALKDHETVIKAKDAEITSLKGATSEGEDEIMKALPESIRKRIETAETKAREAEEAIAKAKSDAEEREAIEKARALNVGDAEKVGKLLLRVSKGMTTADDAKDVEQLLKSAGEIAANSPLFKAIGSASAVEGDPEEMLKAKAAEIQKGSDGKLTYAQAYSKALEQEPALYNAYVAKRRG